jgi:hypothetical protein
LSIGWVYSLLLFIALFMVFFMQLRSLAVFFFTCLFVVLSWVSSPSAIALTQIRLFDISYQNCPSDIAEGTVTSGGSPMAANCFLVTGKAENSTNKYVYDADIFGRIYDANNNPVLQNRTRLGSIPEVPPGISNFDLRISVAANQPEPIQLKQFKATGFSAQVRK